MEKNMNQYIKWKREFENTVMRFAAALFFVGIWIVSKDETRLTALDTLNSFSGKRFLICFILLFCFLSLVRLIFDYYVKNNYDALFLMMAVILYGFCIALHTTDIYFMTVVAFFSVISIRFCVAKLEIYGKIMISGRLLSIILMIAVAITFLYLCSLVVLRVFILKPVTFDYGIFVQAFYYMKKCLIPYTTCERFELLSHFTVHFSPIFYFILPIYVLFPTEYTLVIVQLIAVISGVIPVYLICKNKKMNHFAVLALCIVYLLYPTLRGGLFYDFHENKFLAPLVLWLLYFFEQKKSGKKKLAGIIVFSALILMVKEDAAIYTACIGLFMFFYKKNMRDKLTGGVLSVVSVIYFFVVFHFMGIYGDAGSAITSFGRYDNLMISEFDGVGGLVMNMLKDPGYVLGQLLDAEKLQFLLWMFLPVMFLPLRSRKVSSYILIVPLIVLNLLSDYKYQHIIYYQYAYASGVLVIYLAILEMKKLNAKDAKNMAVAMIVVSVLLSTAAISDRNVYYDDYKMKKESLLEIRELLESIPKDKSVSASTTLVPVLAARDEVYRYTKGDETDYLAFTITTNETDENNILVEEYLANGYHIYGQVYGKVIVLEKN